MFPENDLKVYYPHGGKHYLLCWWTHDEQHHLIVAKSQESAEKAFASVLQEHSDAEPRDFLQVDIVSPSQKYCEVYAKNQLDKEIGTFWSQFTWMVRDYEEETGKFPTKLRKCSSFVSKYSDEDNGGQPVIEDEHHYNCANCHERLLPVEGTFESVYLQHRDAYLALHYSSPPKTVKSRAPLQDHILPLYSIITDFGYHQKGLVFNSEVDIEYMRDEYLFFYQSPRQADRKAIDAAYFLHEENWKAKDEARSKKFREEQEQEKKKRFDMLLSFFGDT